MSNEIINYLLLIGFYLISIWIILFLIYQDYIKNEFSFHFLFSVLYLVIFYFGFPFSFILTFVFNQPIASEYHIFLTQIVMLGSYLIYYLSYTVTQAVEKEQKITNQNIAISTKLEGKLTACGLMSIAIISLGLFIYWNQGFLLLTLKKYQQIFSLSVNGIGLKRLFYFFIPALLIVFFLKPNQKMWLMFLCVGSLLGGLNYLAVGGTRANLILVFMLFLLLGLDKKYLSWRWLIISVGMVVVAMFALALWRYKLDVSGVEIWFTFLYLTRDTFSPWENLMRILESHVEYQGLMPIIRDFYIFIPQTIWVDKPDIIWNTANYFTKELLGNYSGLAISPTLLGSFYIMGGGVMVIFGMVIVGIMIRMFDRLFYYGKNHLNQNYSALIQAYCFANVFNLIVLVREGVDAFFSRFIFFSVVILVCWFISVIAIKIRVYMRWSNENS